MKHLKWFGTGLLIFGAIGALAWLLGNIFGDIQMLTLLFVLLAIYLMYLIGMEIHGGK